MAKKIVGGCLIALVAFTAICLILISGIRYIFKDNYLSKEEIFDVVNKNYDVIIDDIQKGEFTKTEEIKGIEKISDHDGVVEFYCGAKGISVSGAEYGFYYTEDNLPKVSFLPYVLFDEDDLVPKDNGYCFDKYDYYYTEKIRDNFYYYESHFY